MIYEIKVTVPPFTLRDDAIVEEVNISPGRLARMQVTFPDGCAGLVHCQVLYNDLQIAPAALDEDFSGDGITIAFDEGMKISKAPYRLGVRVWNDDDTFEHTVTVRLEVVKENDNFASRLKWLSQNLKG